MLTRPKKNVSIETPPCGYDWTGPGVAALTQKIKETTGNTIEFRFNYGRLYGSNHEEIESKVFIAPTAVLQQHKNYPIYGVYAKQAFSTRLKYPYCLGEYQGKITKSSNESSSEEQEEKVLYTFDLGNGTELNAEHEGSWPRMINSASSEHTANIFYLEINRKTYCFLKHPLQAGEQLLGYYGDAYTYEDEHKRFLHPSDNWQSSQERYQTYKSLYHKITHEGIQYAVPDISKLTNATINLPILEYKKNGQFLPQHQQENKTLLHWACETGDIELLHAVKELNPDLTIQSRLSGHTALHRVMLNYKLSTTNKINFLDEILSILSPKSRIVTLLQDKDDQSILHIAITQKNIQLIQYCLQKATKKQMKKNDEDIRHGLNKQGWDFILASIATGSIEVLETIQPYISVNDLDVIMEDHADVLRDIWSDLITKYDRDKLRDIKGFLSRFFDKADDIQTNDITHQLLDSCLSSPEPGESLSKHHILTSENARKSKYLKLSPKMTLKDIRDHVKLLEPDVVVFDNPEQNLFQRQAVAQALAKHVSFFIGDDVSPKETSIIVSALNADTKLIPNAEMWLISTEYMAKAIRPGVNVQCHRELSERQLRIIAENLQPGVRLWCSWTLTTEYMKLLAETLQPGTVFYCASTMTEEQITTVVPLLKPGVTCTCDTNFSPQKIALIIQSLPQSVRFYCHDNLSLDDIEHITDALKPNQVIVFDPDLPCYKFKKAISTLKAGVTIYYDAKFLKKYPLNSWANDYASGVNLLIDSSINVLFFNYYQKMIALDMGCRNDLQVLIEETPEACKECCRINAKNKRKAHKISQQVEFAEPRLSELSMLKHTAVASMGDTRSEDDHAPKKMRSLGLTK
ncbi:MAG: hypothetical protein P1U36_05470 [Legionellaceae bacterium]|nr:hypothetical protein [Legionellaceae bacterium]